MDTISKEILLDLVESRQGRAVSIYMPVYNAEPEVKQNATRFKNLIREAEKQLKSLGIDQKSVNSFLRPLLIRGEDELFWREREGGLALFLDTKTLHIFDLPFQFQPFVEIGDVFHITPLIPIYQGNGQFILLALDKNRPKIYMGSKYSLSRVKDLDLPEDLQTLFDQYYEFHKHLQFHNKTRSPSSTVSQTTGERKGVFFGQGGDDIDEKEELKNYYDRFDTALMDYLHGKDVPMVLAGVEYLQPIYREANSYPYLLETGISKDIEEMPVEERHQRAWDIVKEQFQMDINQALNVYQALEAKNGNTSEDIRMIVSAAYFKRVNTLFIKASAHTWGTFNPDENKVIVEKDQGPENLDLLNFSAIHTLQNGGNVLLLPGEMVPSERDAAAILRY